MTADRDRNQSTTSLNAHLERHLEKPRTSWADVHWQHLRWIIDLECGPSPSDRSVRRLLRRGLE